MGKTAKIAVGSIASVVVVAASAVGIGRSAFKRRIYREVADLLAMSQSGQSRSIMETDLENLPEPVQRWLRNSHVLGKAYPVTVRLKQKGEFRLAENRGWMPFEAEQYFTTNPPGFVWMASFKMAPLLSVTGRDRYMAGKGDIDMRLLSLIPVAKKSGGGLDQGALLRYLGEIVWFPAAALSPFISWEGLDTTSARATMSYLGVTASATFTFDQEGNVTRLDAERYNDAKSKLEPWTIPIRAFGEFDGIHIPVEGEGVWKYSSGDFSHIRWRITEIEYNQPAMY
jgi:Family of unknown function (DUF6544)